MKFELTWNFETKDILFPDDKLAKKITKFMRDLNEDPRVFNVMCESWSNIDKDGKEY